MRVTFDDGIQSALAYDTITGVNDPPTVLGATPDLRANAYTAVQGVQLVVPNLGPPPVVGVLANDVAGADSNPTSLVAVPASGTTPHGVFSLAANGSFTYTSDPKYDGIDTFTYRANNGTFTYTNAGVSPNPPTTTVPMNSVNSGLVTVTITVLKKPAR